MTTDKLRKIIKEQNAKIAELYALVDELKAAAAAS
jgi:hypothetical protein